MDQHRLAVIIASIRSKRTGGTIARWITDLADQHPALSTDVLDLRDLQLPMGLPDGPDLEVAAYRKRLDAADAFVIVTPEYNHSFTAPMKQAIDLAKHEWAAKPVGFVSYGGISGGLRAVEQLRGVFAELRTVGVRETVSFANAWTRFDADGVPLDREAVDAAGRRLLDEVVWWSEALRNAPTERPWAA